MQERNGPNFWKLRKGKVKKLGAGRVLVGPNRRVTRSSRQFDQHFRLTCAEMAKYTKSKWVGCLGEIPEPLPSNCFVGPRMAQWLAEHLQMPVAT